MRWIALAAALWFALPAAATPTHCCTGTPTTNPMFSVPLQSLYYSGSFKKTASWQLGAGSSGNYCASAVIRIGYGSQGSGCTYFPTIANIADTLFVWWSMEGGIATTDTKDPAIVNGASQLMFTRDDTTGGPASFGTSPNFTPTQSAWDNTAKQGCSQGPNVPTNSCYPNCAPCYTAMQNILDGTASACFARRRCVGGSAAGTVCTSNTPCTGGGTCEDSNATRGARTGLSLKRMIAEVNAQSAVNRPGKPTPKHIAVIRWDLLQPADMQIEGFLPSFLAQPTGATTHDAFRTWLATTSAARNDPICKTTNGDCTGKNGGDATYPPWTAGLKDIPNGVCIDGKTCVGGSNAKGRCVSDVQCPGGSCVANTYAWENFATGSCGHSFSWNGFAGCAKDGSQGWNSCWQGKDNGFEYDTLISLRGGNPNNAVYYYTRPGGALWSPNGAVARQDDDAYIAWRVQRAKKLIDESGADYVHLNHKISQYETSTRNWIYGPAGVTKYDGACKACAGGAREGLYCTNSSQCTGGGACTGTINPSMTTVEPAEVVCKGDGGWSGDPANYTVDDYTNGLEKIGAALHAAGLKYQWTVNATYWYRLARNYPTTTSYAHIRAVTLGADLVFVEGGDQVGDAPGVECNAGCSNCTGTKALKCELKNAGTPFIDIGANTYTEATCAAQ